MMPDKESALNPEIREFTDDEFYRLIALLGSIDQSKRNSAYQNLITKWDSVPLSKTPPKEVSFSEILDRYSDDQLQLIASQCVALELTEGCNNFCPFCLYRSKGEPVQRGITAKFVLRNISRFIYKFAPHLGDGFDFYHFSDVLDAEISTFLKVYNDSVIKDNASVYHRVLTTAVAPGREQELINLLSYLFSNSYKSYVHEDMYVRLSINDANQERINLALAQFIRQEKLKGASEEKLKSFLRKRLFKEDRRDIEKSSKIVPQGRLIGKKNFYDISTVSCRVGTILTPSGIKGVCPVAATPFNPAGEAQYDIPPEKVKELTPKKSVEQQIRFKSIGYQNQNYVNYLAGDNSPPLLNIVGEEIILDDKYQTALMHIGRETHALNEALYGYRALYFRLFFKEGEIESNIIKINAPDRLQKRIDRLKKYAQIMLKVKNASESETHQYKEASYYLILSEIFQTKIEILISALEDLKNPIEWAEVGAILLEATTPQLFEKAKQRIAEVFNIQ